MNRHVRARLRAAVTICTAAALAAGLPLHARADDPGEAFAEGVSTQTVWGPGTTLVGHDGSREPGLVQDDRFGVTEVRFSPTGEAVVAERTGRLVYFSSTSDRTGTVLSDGSGRDLTPDVLATHDTGLGGVTFDPGWPQKPYLYVSYTSNRKHPSQGTGRWTTDECGPKQTCIVDARIERLTVQLPSGSTGQPVITARRTLIGSGWCQRAATHSMGDVAFGPDGYLYATAGDGTWPSGPTQEQRAICSDRVDPRYAGRTAALDVLDSTAHVSLNGKVIRIDPATGLGAPTNPFAGSKDPNRARVVMAGLRNPYRIAFRAKRTGPAIARSRIDHYPVEDRWDGGTMALTSVGNDRVESVFEIELASLRRQPANGGWPCWEGSLRYDDGPLCRGLSRSARTLDTPVVEWHRGEALADEPCPTTGSQAAMGVAYATDDFPSRYRGSLFINDYGRGCVWSKGEDAAPRFLASFPRHTIRSLTAYRGQLWFPDRATGSVRRFVLPSR